VGLPNVPATDSYLSATIGSYLSPSALTALARSSGWAGIELESINLGTVAVLLGRRPG
jgi:hypothetical protein